MIIGKVKTITLKWWTNVLIGMTKGVYEYDYWTSGWLPQREIDRLEVYYEGDRVLSGTVINCFKSSPDRIYKCYKNTPYSIGLDDATNSLQEFEKLLEAPFGKAPDEIGNIVFKVDSVSKKTLEAILSNKSVDFNTVIVELEPKSEDKKKIKRRIIYEEI